MKDIVASRGRGQAFLRGARDSFSSLGALVKAILKRALLSFLCICLLCHASRSKLTQRRKSGKSNRASSKIPAWSPGLGCIGRYPFCAAEGQGMKI